MTTIERQSPSKDQFGAYTLLLANVCHRCGICPYADRKPQSRFGRLMRRHRTWCPAWAAHTKVFGRKPLS
jgi:hypothetical protein